MSKTLRPTDTTFEGIKEELVSFISSKPEFADFDFEGSNLSILIDLLTYNTYYNNFYLNMVSNEMFLDTAKLRNSVLGHARKLGYSANSKKGAVADIKLSIITDNNPNSILIPKYTKFESTVDNVAYPFYAIESYSALKDPVSGKYVADNIKIRQGKVLSHRFIYNDDPDQKFIIPNESVDIDSITVTIFENQDSENGTVYTNVKNALYLGSDDLIYFVEEVNNGLYEIIFGDGTIGTSLENGNLIRVDYATTKANNSFGAKDFLLLDNIGYTLITIETNSPAAGGSEEESIESIKYLAPKSYQSQNRLVTAEDYATLILKEYPEFEAVKAWGGEENVPAFFGKVFISIKPAEGTALSQSTRESIINRLLKAKSIVSITPEIIEPEYIWLNVNIESKYNPNETRLGADEIKNKIKNTVLNYSNDELEKFDSYFQYSKLLGLIDNSDVSVKNSNMSFNMIIRHIPRLNENQKVTFNFNNSIYHPNESYDNSLKSSKFTYNGFEDCYLSNFDDIVRIVRKPINTVITIEENAGTIDYDTGTIVVNNFNVSGYDGDYISIEVQPGSPDIIPRRNQILQIQEDLLDVSLIDENLLRIGSFTSSSSNIFTQNT